MPRTSLSSAITTGLALLTTAAAFSGFMFTFGSWYGQITMGLSEVSQKISLIEQTMGTTTVQVADLKHHVGVLEARLERLEPQR